MIGKKGIHAWMADTDVTSGTDIFNAIGRIIVDCKVEYMINSRVYNVKSSCCYIMTYIYKWLHVLNILLVHMYIAACPLLKFWMLDCDQVHIIMCPQTHMLLYVFKYIDL